MVKHPINGSPDDTYYIRRQIPVRAMKYDGNNAWDIMVVFGQENFVRTDDGFYCLTSKGQLVVLEGNYVLQNSQTGDFRPIAEKEFMVFYQPFPTYSANQLNAIPAPNGGQ